MSQAETIRGTQARRHARIHIKMRGNQRQRRTTQEKQEQRVNNNKEARQGGITTDCYTDIVAQHFLQFFDPVFHFGERVLICNVVH